MTNLKIQWRLSGGIAFDATQQQQQPQQQPQPAPAAAAACFLKYRFYPWADGS